MSKTIVLKLAMKEKFAIMVLSAVLMFFLNPLLQSVNTSLAFEIWFIDLYQKPFNSSLYIIFSLLFGIFVSLYLFSRNKCIDCEKQLSRTRSSTSSSSGFIGSVVGFMLGVCPACFSFIGFIIPLSTSIILTTYVPLFTSISIGILIFSIYKVGGFKVIDDRIISTKSKR
jgi:hypothetical protein